MNVNDFKVIDMHTHILPNMDDGSLNTEMSVQMLKIMADQGVDLVCASSHYYHFKEDISYFLKRRIEAFENLRLAAHGRNLGLPALILAAEVAYFPGISECKKLKDICIEGTKTVLLEMPFTEWTDAQIQEVIGLVLDRNFRVVLVHPERFLFSKNNKHYLLNLLELPIGIQVNASTLVNWKTRKDGLELLEKASFPLLGSDAHNLSNRRPNLAEGGKVIIRRLGQVFWQKMQQNAQDMVRPVVINYEE